MDVGNNRNEMWINGGNNGNDMDQWWEQLYIHGERWLSSRTRACRTWFSPDGWMDGWMDGTVVTQSNSLSKEDLLFFLCKAFV